MFVSQDRFERLWRRVEELENKVRKLEQENTIYADSCASLGWEYFPGRYKQVSLKEAVQAVLSHCGIAIEYENEVKARIKVSKTKEKKK